MNIIVCVKAVRSELVDSEYAKQGDYRLNPYDTYSLQKIIDLKEVYSCHITCITMGPKSSESVLRKCLTMGADEAILLSDSVFSGADTYATSRILAQAIEKFGKFDLIVCGSKAVDGETGQVVYSLAKRLNLPCLSNAEEVLAVEQKMITVRLKDEAYKKTVKGSLPALLSFDDFTMKQTAESLFQLRKAQKAEISLWDSNYLGILGEDCGQKGSKTRVIEIYENKVIKKESVLLEGEHRDQAKQLIHLLHSEAKGQKI